jgi:hypothetical protein
LPNADSVRQQRKITTPSPFGREIVMICKHTY